MKVFMTVVCSVLFFFSTGLSMAGGGPALYQYKCSGGSHDLEPWVLELDEKREAELRQAFLRRITDVEMRLWRHGGQCNELNLYKKMSCKVSEKGECVLQSLTGIEPGLYNVHTSSFNFMTMSDGTQVRQDLFTGLDILRVRRGEVAKLVVRPMLNETVLTRIEIRNSPGVFIEGNLYSGDVEVFTRDDSTTASSMFQSSFIRDGDVLRTLQRLPVTASRAAITLTDENGDELVVSLDDRAFHNSHLQHPNKLIYDFANTGGVRVTLNFPREVEEVVIVHAALDGRCVYETNPKTGVSVESFCVSHARKEFITGVESYGGVTYVAVNRGAVVRIQKWNRHGAPLERFEVTTQNANERGSILDFAFEETGFWGINGDILHYSKNGDEWMLDKTIKMASGWSAAGVAFDQKERLLYALVTDVEDAPYIFAYDELGNELSRAKISIDLNELTKVFFGLGFDQATGSLWTSMSHWHGGNSGSMLLEMKYDGESVRIVFSVISARPVQYGSVSILTLPAK